MSVEAKARPAVEAVLADLLRDYPHEAARELEALPVRDAARLLAARPVREAASVLGRAAPDLAAALLGELPVETAAPILETLDAERAAMILARAESELRDRWLAGLSPATARELRELLAYPPDTAGSLMDPHVLALRRGTTVADVRRRLRRLPPERSVTDLFVVDEEGRLEGSFPVLELVRRKGAELVDALARPVRASVRPTASREEVAEILTSYGVTTLPVVDVEGRLLGVIRHGRLVRAVEEEATADLQTMVGASKEERALSPVRFAVAKRLPWLEVNLATAFLAAAVVGLFEETIARFTALAVLLPVVAGQSGNSGAQALAVTMRGVALREIRTRHWLTLCLKEMAVGLVNGIAIALTTGLFVYLWSGSVGLTLVIALSMVLSLVVAGLAGAVIPLVLVSFGQDPAQSSSIFLTTVTDVVGFFSFLGIATILAPLL